MIQENIGVFAANGFKLDVDLERPVGKRVKISAVPFSKSIQFGKEDVLELASMLDESADDSVFVSKLLLTNDDVGKTVGSERRISLELGAAGTGSAPLSSGTTSTNICSSNRSSKGSRVRLPKLVSMFASRACRSAIMIGTALQHREMKSIVEKLAGIEQPWNCPHGRPTMKHLFDLETISSENISDR